MPALLDDRLAEIASWLEVVQKKLDGPSFDLPIGVGRTNIDAYISQWNEIAKRLGYGIQVGAAGPAAAGEAAELKRLVSQGKLTGREANAYLAQKYPDQKWAGGVWGGKPKHDAAEQQAQADAPLPDGDPAKRDVLDRALDAQQAAGDSPAFGATPTDQTIRMDELPEDWDPVESQNVLETSFARVTARLSAIQRGGVKFDPHTVDGSVLVPGSVPMAALDPVGSRDQFTAMPGPDQAILLDVAASDSMDREVESSLGSLGPGRVWRVNGSQRPDGWRPVSGPLRYRMPLDGVRFGVSSVVLLDGDGPPSIRVRYGIILQGIPSWGRRVTTLHSIHFVGDGPVPYATANVEPRVGHGGSFTLYHTWARNVYESANYPFLTAYGANPFLDPAQADIDACQGFSVGLITGRSPHDVYQQVNTRASSFGRVWSSSGAIPSRSIPDAAGGEPLTVAQALGWDGQAGSPGYSSLTGDVGTETRMVEGFPISPQSCKRLRNTENTFSLVIQPLMFFDKVLGLNDNMPVPANWAAHGVLAEAGRDWQIDIIVE